MDAALKTAIKKVTDAKTPEDVFGDDCDGIKPAYRELATLLHPDKPASKSDQKAKEEAFKRLGEWKELADKKVEVGTYGDRTAMTDVKIEVKGNKYTLTRTLPPGDLCNIYTGTNTAGDAVLLKVTRTSANNAFVKNEADRLRWMRTEGPTKALKAMQFIPELLDSFELQQGKERKQVNVLRVFAGSYTLAQVHGAYDEGLDPRDSAWMFNRLMAALLMVHQSGLVHGCVIPSHVLVNPGSHAGMLIDFTTTVKKGENLKFMSKPWETMYPADVINKRPTTFGLDLYMASKVYGYITKLGLPRPIQGLMNACQIGYIRRQQDVYELHEDFDKALKVLYGPRKFRDFTMPTPSSV